MSDETDTTLEVAGLDKLIKLFGQKLPTTRVGVLGSKTARGSESNKAGLTNAEIGAFHEYALDPEKRRSFLRVPLADHLDKRLEALQAFDEASLKEAIGEGSLVSFMKKLGLVAEDIVLGAFDSGGYGKWKPSNMAHKKNHQTLVETQQLRNSITSDVQE